MVEKQRFRLNARAGVETAAPPAVVTKLPPHVARSRRATRSRDILQAVVDIDVATDPATRKQLTDWLKEAYDLRGGGDLVGLFAKCHLGYPYVDHKLAIVGEILEHYTPGDTVQDPFGRARAYARNDAYLFIEIYSDGAVVPVRANGESAV